MSRSARSGTKGEVIVQLTAGTCGNLETWPRRAGHQGGCRRAVTGFWEAGILPGSARSGTRERHHTPGPSAAGYKRFIKYNYKNKNHEWLIISPIDKGILPMTLRFGRRNATTTEPARSFGAIPMNRSGTALSCPGPGPRRLDPLVRCCRFPDSRPPAASRSSPRHKGQNRLDPLVRVPGRISDSQFPAPGDRAPAAS